MNDTHHITAEREYINMEKRKFTRFRVQDDAYAALQGNYTKVGRIYDISLKGMAFRYLAEETSNEKFAQVDIFLTNNDFHLIGIPCTIIYDVEESTFFNINGVLPYRCGMKFGSLKDEQQNSLEFFIDNYNTGALES